MLVALSCLFAAMGINVRQTRGRAFSAPEIRLYRSLISLLLMFVIVRSTGVFAGTRHWRQQCFRGASVRLAAAVSMRLPCRLATAVTRSTTLRRSSRSTSPPSLVCACATIAALLTGFVGVIVPVAADALAADPVRRRPDRPRLQASCRRWSIQRPHARCARRAGSADRVLFRALCDHLQRPLDAAQRVSPIDLGGGLLLLGVGGFMTWHSCR